jgi:DNA-binding winged helix-turn-helix (wHTH) protein/tetratricopeptide (TPR) repeat protein
MPNIPPINGAAGERRVFYFGPFTLDVGQRCLFRRGIPVRITNRALVLLHLLVRHSGESLSVDDIMTTVWDDKEDVTDATLRQHVLMLRHVLEDTLADRYIVTEYGRGYRFIGEVTEQPPPFMVSLVEQYCAAGAEFRAGASPAAMLASLNLYERALTIDGGNAHALAGAALTRVLMADFHYDRPKDLLEVAKGQAEAALRTSPECVQALSVMSKVTLDYSWDFAGALECARRAFALDSSDRIAAFMCGWIPALGGRVDEALAFADALPEDVASLSIIRTGRGIATLFWGDYERAAAELDAVLASRPDYWFARTFLGLAQLMLGKAATALALFDEVRLSAYDPLVTLQMNARYFAEAYALYTRFRIGDTANAEKTLGRLTRLEESEFVPAMCFALAELGRNDRDAARRCIEVAADNRECWYTHLGVEPLAKELALDPTKLYARTLTRSDRSERGAARAPDPTIASSSSRRAASSSTA